MWVVATASLAAYTAFTMARQTTTIMAIETSCDETGVALVRCRRSRNNYHFKVIKHLLHSQIKTHRQYGGVVPEVAAREHAVRLPVLLKVLTDMYGLTNLHHKVDAIAVTAGPGLVTSLLVGVETARTMSFVWQKPLVAVNHLEGHIYANLLRANSRMSNVKIQMPNFEFPLLALIVSGGHTELVLMKKHLSYQLLGSTRDDAAGEAFDKTAKLLGLSYPGGPALAGLAARGNPKAVIFPRPMLDQPNLDFSFAGLKTAVAIHLQKNYSGILPNSRAKLTTGQDKNTRIAKLATRADIAASFEVAVVDTLVGKTLRAVEKYKPRTVLLAGGVAANLMLRQTLEQSLAAKFPKTKFLKPSLNFATDNAAMIAAAGAVRYLNGHSTTWERIKVDPQLPLK